MIEEELQIVSNLTGIDPKDIKLSDDGFLSRGYIIDDGRIVFKFKKYPEISYQNEIKMLNFVNSLNLGINLQKVGWVSENDSYLGLYGIIGKSLDSASPAETDYENYGKQIGLFLKKLHSANFSEAKKLTLSEEISEWQRRFEEAKDILARYFNKTEIEKMSIFMNHTAPEQLTLLGEKMVLSHGDLWTGNIFIGSDGKIGIIDFGDSVYLDEAADFMDIEDDKLYTEILKSYGTNDVLEAKIKIRKAARPLFVIGTYRDKPEKEIQHFVGKIRTWLK